MNKELKNRIHAEYSKAWDERMADFCTKQLWDAIDVNGKLVVGKKPDLQSEFYFGYSDCGQGLSFEENNDRMDTVSRNKIRYFIEQNIEPLNKIVEKFKTSYFVYVYNVCYGDTPIGLYEAKFANYNLLAEGETPYRNKQIKAEYRELTKQERETLIKFYEGFIEKHTKRVLNYAKRFGNNISINSYWIDR
jgi:hypothetical protein